MSRIFRKSNAVNLEFLSCKAIEKVAVVYVGLHLLATDL